LLYFAALMGCIYNQDVVRPYTGLREKGGACTKLRAPRTTASMEACLEVGRPGQFGDNGQGSYFVATLYGGTIGAVDPSMWVFAVYDGPRKIAQWKGDRDVGFVCTSGFCNVEIKELDTVLQRGHTYEVYWIWIPDESSSASASITLE
jgi:hypothetical protein